MKFLDVFNEVEKGNYALTDEAIYASINNSDELIPLYGGNKEHISTERKISVSAKTKKGVPITVFQDEGIIISLDGSSGCMTYKKGEKFALNHHAGFITLRKDAINKVNLEFFAIYMQNFYRGISVSDGSKTLSLTQLYQEDFDLPAYETQCQILQSLRKISKKMDLLNKYKEKLLEILDKELVINYTTYQAENVPISKCIDYLSGNSGLTEEYVYQTLQNKDERFDILSSATEDRTMMGTVPLCEINGRNLKVFKNREGLLVTRNGKAGQTRFLAPGKYTINDHAYILFNRQDSPFEINLKWLGFQYNKTFLAYSLNSDNGTWNMTGFFKYTTIDIPSIEEQRLFVKAIENVQNKINAIDNILKRYYSLICKEITN
ncbi:MAG: restriction endonuclease subunit S [Ruminococcus sp.]|nr:restriction endonuclease subunit S [Ruminococcus sp.]